MWSAGGRPLTSGLADSFLSFCGAHVSVMRFRKPPKESLAHMLASKTYPDCTVRGVPHYIAMSKRARMEIVLLPPFLRAAQGRRADRAPAPTSSAATASASGAPVPGQPAAAARAMGGAAVAAGQSTARPGAPIARPPPLPRAPSRKTPAPSSTARARQRLPQPKRPHTAAHQLSGRRPNLGRPPVAT